MATAHMVLYLFHAVFSPLVTSLMYIASDKRDAFITQLEAMDDDEDHLEDAGIIYHFAMMEVEDDGKDYCKDVGCYGGW